MTDMRILMVILSVIAGFVLSFLLGKWLLPVLRALKAGQSIREVGPKWHSTKSGTPTMGGLMFIAASFLCLATVWIAMSKNGDYGHLYVLGLALMFGLIGFYDDYIKVKKKRQSPCNVWQV